MSLFSAVQAACIIPPDRFVAGASPTSARQFKIICLLYLAIGVMRLSGGLVQRKAPNLKTHNNEWPLPGSLERQQVREV